MVLKFRDSDTGESELDVVEVPEGLSLQVGFVESYQIDKDDLENGYISIILNTKQELELFDFLLKRQSDRVRS